MCGCEPTFVCTRCEGTRDDWRTDFDPEPETHQERAERLTQEFAVRVVDPAVKGAKP